MLGCERDQEASIWECAVSLSDVIAVSWVQKVHRSAFLLWGLGVGITVFLLFSISVLMTISWS